MTDGELSAGVLKHYLSRNQLDALKRAMASGAELDLKFEIAEEFPELQAIVIKSYERDAMSIELIPYMASDETIVIDDRGFDE
jgi:hypothetical protein